MSDDTAWKNSPEYDDWIEETGGRDEDFQKYYERWLRRTGQWA